VPKRNGRKVRRPKREREGEQLKKQAKKENKGAEREKGVRGTTGRILKKKTRSKEKGRRYCKPIQHRQGSKGPKTGERAIGLLFV